MPNQYKIILFDGICNLCNSSVNFIIKRDKKNIFRFASLQSDIGIEFKNKLPKNFLDVDSFILIECEKKFYIKSSAALRIAKYLGFPYNMVYIFNIIPPFIRNFIYDLVAKKRYKWFGRRESCRVPTNDELDKFLE